MERFYTRRLGSLWSVGVKRQLSGKMGDNRPELHKIMAKQVQMRIPYSIDLA